MAIHRKALITRQAKMDAYTALLNGGSVEFWTGTCPALPSDADGGTLLATVDLGNPAFSATDASGIASIILGSLVSNIQVGLGDIGYARWKTSGGATVSITDAGITTEAVVVDKVAVAAGEKVTILSCALTEPM